MIFQMNFDQVTVLLSELQEVEISQL